MKLSLNISERVYALKILNVFKGSIEVLSAIIEDVKKFTITEKEWEKAGRIIEPVGDGNTNWRWEDDKGGLKEIEIEKATASFIKEDIKEKSGKGELTIQDKAVTTLLEKL